MIGKSPGKRLAPRGHGAQIGRARFLARREHVPTTQRGIFFRDHKTSSAPVIIPQPRDEDAIAPRRWSCTQPENQTSCLPLSSPCLPDISFDGSLGRISPMSSAAVDPISDSTPSGSVSAGDPLIEVEGVTKIYHLWESPSARLKHAVIGGLAEVAPGRAREVLRAKNARYRSDFCALRDFSLRVERGGRTGCGLAKNGSGKQMLRLQIIALAR